MAPQLPTRECTHCHESKPATPEFFHRNGKYLRPKCKSCSDHSRDRVFAKKLYHYNITEEQYNQMLAEQGGVCAICANPMPDDNTFSVDHDHDCCSGNRACGNCNRGLLCRNCNSGLAMFSDDVDRLASALEYLQLNKKKSGSRRLSPVL